MANIFNANNIIILPFSNAPDSQGSIIPPECHVIFPDKIDVFYGNYLAGEAALKRIPEGIVADFTLRSRMIDSDTAAELIAALYPAVELEVHDYHRDTFFNITITGLFLTPYQNDSIRVTQLGQRLLLKKKKSYLM